MSLQVWLPLLGNLNNQGVQGNAVTSSNYSSASGGKLGACIKTNANGNIPLGYSSKQCNTGSLSFCGWFKFNKAEIWNTISSLTYNSTNTGIGCSIIGNNSYGGVGIYATSNSIYADGTLNSLSIRAYWRTSTASAVATNTYTISWDTWVHACAVYNKSSNLLSFYINGSLFSYTSIPAFTDMKDATIAINFAGIAGGNGNARSIPMSVNDVRIYDHALSKKEVAEIAKALVLHYKLDDIYIEPTTNLITTTDCLTSTCYNGATSKYGYGTSTDMYKTTGIFNGRFCTKLYMGTDGLAARPYVYISPLSVSNGTNAPAYRTLSFDYFTTVTNNVCMYKLGSGSGTTSWKITVNGTTNTYTTGGGSGTADSVPVVVGEWNHIEVTFHGTTSANAEFGYLINGNYNHTSSTSNYWLFSNMQIENKDHATGYAGVNGTRSDTQVCDSSGLGYNGTIVNTLLTNSDTIRYDVSTQFSGSNYIKVTSPSTEALTISVWAKWNSIPSGQSVIYVDYKSKTGLGLMSTGILCKSTNGNSNTFSKSGIVANTWYHFVIVCPNGTASVTRQLYINGVAQSPTSNTSTWSYDIDELQIGKRSTTSDGFNGKLVDFRMYGKVFTAEEVLELYHTEASMDRGGNYYTRELME